MIDESARTTLRRLSTASSEAAVLVQLLEEERQEIVFRVMESTSLPEERNVLLDTLLHLAIVKLEESEENAALPDFLIAR